VVALNIEDYALIGDMSTAALVGRDGSIDWFCAPRFDSPACFAALVGTPDNGRWLIAPADPVQSVTRRYAGDSLVLETTFTCSDGSVTLRDAMLPEGGPRIRREVEGRSGRVAMRMEYLVRFDYGSIVPWVREEDGGLLAVAGPDALLLRTSVTTRAEGFKTVAEFTVEAGTSVAFDLAYYPSYEAAPHAAAGDACARACAASRAWLDDCVYAGPYRDIAMRSLLTLKALTFAATGGIVAAPTTSLPEKLGGIRNWDYRYCWLRDATFTLYAMLAAGHKAGAVAWRAWLLRAIAGEPKDLQIVYSIRGGRRIPEAELPWLDGYQGARPVRVGNDADGQFQLDVYGEVIDLLFASHRFGIETTPDEWSLARAIIDEVTRRWKEPDRGLWEVRGEPQHFTHSKVMAWVALDRGVAAIESYGLEGPLERWRSARAEIRAEILARGYDATRGTFTQYFGSQALDASTLLIPSVGFLPAEDPRVRGTVAAIERELVRDGFVLRYTQSDPNGPDPLPPGEGVFLACSFWLVDNYVLAGRLPEAHALFERLVALANDVGLLAEEYDPLSKRHVGNFPQAFSHVGLINSAFNMSHDIRPAMHRSGEGAEPNAS
jgi:GH15 family glucan-1,4-alpha-glucosidase